MSAFALVDARFVARLSCAAEDGPPWILLESHFTSCDHPAPRVDRSGHIPGAIQVHPSFLDAGLDRTKYYPHYAHPADANLLSDRPLATALRRLGITPDTLVVIYGKEPAGAMAAARLAWGLLYAGVARVRLLDGGLRAWRTHGGATVPCIATACDVARERETVEPDPSWPTRRDVRATAEEVRAVANGCNASKLVDVRGHGEWNGTDTCHYPFFSRAGHIPNAIHQGDWDNLLCADSGTLGSRLGDVAARWRAQGILDADVAAGRTTLIFYCGTGWRSSVAFLVAWLLGLRAKNYDDGFYGWSHADGTQLDGHTSPNTRHVAATAVTSSATPMKSSAMPARKISRVV